MALKKCVKTHKLFLAELERCGRLEREGEQVLSSLANVSQRLPLLLQSASSQPHEQQQQPHTAIDSSSSAMGVLSFCVDTQSRLLAKHFASLEKSMAFLRDIVTELLDVLRRMKSFASEYADLLDLLDADESTASSFAFVGEQLEWMENVLRMHEHEVLRKRVLVADVEYHDAERLARMHARWSARSVHSNVDHSYVRAGIEPLPAIPKPAAEASADTSSSSKAAATTQKKKNRSKSKR